MEKKALIESVRRKAEDYYERGELFCSEAVVNTINELLGWPFPEEVVKMASGFPVGLGRSGCLCGAVSGGTMALGMVYGRKPGEPMNEKMFQMSAGLHDHIKGIYKSTCCRVLTRNYEFSSPERKAHCVKITGEVAAWIAEKLLEDPDIAARIKMR
nr:MAG: hypothetical protein DIU66_08260 [Bacillota bacterium]